MEGLPAAFLAMISDGLETREVASRQIRVACSSCTDPHRPRLIRFTSARVHNRRECGLFISLLDSGTIISSARYLGRGVSVRSNADPIDARSNGFFCDV